MLERCVSVLGDKAHADLLAQPLYGIGAAPHENLRQVGVSAILRSAAQIVEVFLRRVGPEVAGGKFFFSQVSYDALDVVDPLIHKPHAGPGKRAVAAAQFLWSALEH